MLNSHSQNVSQRIIPTSEEMKVLREKLNNIKDLYIVRNSSKNIQPTGRNVLGREEEKTSTKDLIMKSSTTTKLLTKENNNNENYVGNFIENSFHKEAEKVGKSNLNSNNINSSSYSLHDKEQELQQSSNRYKEIQKFMELNRDKIERVEKYDELLKENEYLKSELEKNQFAEGNQTFADILSDYMSMKIENISIKKQLEEKDLQLMRLEKENKMVKDVESNTPANKNYLKIFIVSLLTKNFNKIFESELHLKILNELFGGNSIDLIQFLSQRIDTLEIQNFQLITKMEKFNHITKNYLTELVEYSDVISDIRNVLNQVYESQSLTTEFLIIRDTLNNRGNYILNQKENFIEEKERLDKDNTRERNLEIILCKDKIVESKVNISNTTSLNQNSKSMLQNNKIFDILDEKIEMYENIKNNLAQYEDYINRIKDEEIEQNPSMNIAENLMNENYMLKSKNIRLQDLLLKFLKNKKELKEENVAELNEITNTHRDFVYSEDLFNMVKAQALMIENNLVLK